MRGIRREMLARAIAEEDLRGANTDLERRVRERTAEIVERQRRFVDLFEHAPDALVMVNREGAIVQVNLQTEALFGWRRSDLIGQPIETLVLPMLAQAMSLCASASWSRPAPTPWGQAARICVGFAGMAGCFPWASA